MATSYTTNLNLGKPGINDAGWGATLNSSLDTLDAYFDAGPFLKTCYGGTGINSSTETGNVRIDAGVWSVQADTESYIPWVTPYGLTLSNSAVDATNDIDIALGNCNSGDATPADRVGMVLASTLTKRLDAAWAVGTNQGGLDTGSIGDGTYHIWLIKRVDTGVVDALFSASATSPTMPASYTKKRRIGSIVRASSAIRAFVQDGNYFCWKAPVNDLLVVNPGTAAALRTLTVPSGVELLAHVAATVGGHASQYARWYLSDPAADDTAPGGVFGTVLQPLVSVSAYIQAEALCRTNTSAQIRSRLDYSDAGTTVALITKGWFDGRLS